MQQPRSESDIFVPRISFFKYQDQLVSAVAWTDSIPTLIPRVDYLAVVRFTLAPRRWFRRKPDACFVTLDDVRQWVDDFTMQGHALPTVTLQYTVAPPDLLSYVRSLEPADPRPEGVQMDQVHNRELVEKSQKGE